VAAERLGPPFLRKGTRRLKEPAFQNRAGTGTGKKDKEKTKNWLRIRESLEGGWNKKKTELFQILKKEKAGNQDWRLERSCPASPVEHQGGPQKKYLLYTREQIRGGLKGGGYEDILAFVTRARKSNKFSGKGTKRASCNWSIFSRRRRRKFDVERGEDEVWEHTKFKMVRD